MMNLSNEGGKEKDYIQRHIPHYKVEKAQIRTDDEYEVHYLITADGIPEYLVNDFLLEKSRKSLKTAKTYASSLVKLLKENFTSFKFIHFPISLDTLTKFPFALNVFNGSVKLNCELFP